jgi:hypothetical protein
VFCEGEIGRNEYDRVGVVSAPPMHVLRLPEGIIIFVGDLMLHRAHEAGKQICEDAVQYERSHERSETPDQGTNPGRKQMFQWRTEHPCRAERRVVDSSEGNKRDTVQFASPTFGVVVSPRTTHRTLKNQY